MRPITNEDIKKLVPKKHIKNFKLPKDFDKIDWSKKNFLGWIHPSGHLGYILEDFEESHRLWIFDCNTSNNNSTASMCSICLSIHGRGKTGTNIFSIQDPVNKNTRNGYYICADLGCDTRVMEINENSMRETLTTEDKVIRMLINLENLIKYQARKA